MGLFFLRKLREGDGGINNIRKPKIGEERGERERGGYGEGNANETKRW